MYPSYLILQKCAKDHRYLQHLGPDLLAENSRCKMAKGLTVIFIDDFSNQLYIFATTNLQVVL